jgi:hypothetical protein
MLFFPLTSHKFDKDLRKIVNDYDDGLTSTTGLDRASGIPLNSERARFFWKLFNFQPQDVDGGKQPPWLLNAVGKVITQTASGVKFQA